MGAGGIIFFLPNIIEVTRAGVSAYFNQVKNVLRGASEHTHANKQDVVEPHARAVALHDPHTPPFPTPP
jgi:hypothetical protein